MQPRLLPILVCPRCGGNPLLSQAETATGAEIVFGSLSCSSCAASYPILQGIPRFAEDEGYAASFGLQWNRFRSEQLDSVSGLRLSEQRFFRETGWSESWMHGRWILDAGCGAGRFLEVAARTGAEVVGVDLSRAVEAAHQNLKGRGNVHIVQANLYALPFRKATFDGCYCIGVLQHAPDPGSALASLPPVLAPGGRLAATLYEKRGLTGWNGKYLLRPITRRMNQRLLLFLIQCAMPLLFPLTEILFRLPGVGRFFQFAIPVANYVETRELTLRARYRWALLDTFDMLSPRYDQPQTLEDVSSILHQAGMEKIERTADRGLCVAAEKPVKAGA